MVYMNELTISGDKALLIELKDFVRLGDLEFSFQKICPVPMSFAVEIDESTRVVADALHTGYASVYAQSHPLSEDCKTLFGTCEHQRLTPQKSAQKRINYNRFIENILDEDMADLPHGLSKQEIRYIRTNWRRNLHFPEGFVDLDEAIGTALSSWTGRTGKAAAYAKTLLCLHNTRVSDVPPLDGYTVSSWGCRSEVFSDISVKFTERGELFYQFYADGMPTGVICRLSERFKDLRFALSSCSTQERGMFFFQNGSEIERDTL